MAAEKNWLKRLGCLANAINTLQGARKLSTNKKYSQACKAFVSFLQQSGADSSSYGLKKIIDFLQCGLELSIMISSLMLLTQKVTSLAMDLQEGKVTFTMERRKVNVLSVISYFMFFPALLGGPHCSFVDFQQQVGKPSICNNSGRAWTLTRGFTVFILLQTLQSVLIEKITFQCDLMNCSHINCIYVMWSTALIYKLTYYSHWFLDEALFHTAGFFIEFDSHTNNSDIDIFTLETTNKISVFARTWNKSTAKWLRRLIFQNCRTKPLLCTFAFSACWHGLYPGQIFGFLCWAVMVQNDYQIHTSFKTISKTWYIQILYRMITWLHTQLIIAYIMLAIEMRTLASTLALCFSYNSLFPMLYYLSFIFTSKIKQG
ncbi:ghrelin O-acyltransferase [Gastrophryne carolinensis]